MMTMEYQNQNQNEFVLHATARAVILNQGYILLQKKQDLHSMVYYLPGGHIELQERAEDAVVREILEETGHAATHIRFLGCIENILDLAVCKRRNICHTHEYALIFFATVPSCVFPEIPCCIDPEQVCSKLCWMLVSELGTMNFCPTGTGKRVREWIDQNYSGAFVEAIV